MDVGRRKGGGGATSSRIGVVAGSVWESRMKLDEVKGGIKVFNGEKNGSNDSEENDEKDGGSSNRLAIVPAQVDKKMNLRPKTSPVGASGKRKTWKSDSSEKSPIQIARQRSETNKNLDEQFRELSMSADGIKRSPAQSKKSKSEAIKDLGASVDGIEKSPIQSMKIRSASQKFSSESSDGNDKNPTQLRKLKSETIKALNTENASEKTSELRKVKSDSIKAVEDSSNGNVNNSLQLVKAKTVSSKDFDDDNGKSSKVQSEKEKAVVDESNKSPKEDNIVRMEKTRSDEDCKEVDVCEEKVITSNISSNAGQQQVKSPPTVEDTDDFDDADGDEEDWDDELEEEGDQEIEVEIEKTSLVVKEISVAEQKPKKVVVEEKKFRQSNERPMSIPSLVKKQSPPVVSHARVHPSPTKKDQVSARTRSKLQSIVDLVMWRDASKSAFVFGIGTFIIISSSYAKDLNISAISVLSYLGLIYLAAIFLFRSLISRGAVDLDDSSTDYVVGEEEAVWLVKLILPCVNEFLLKIKALFSGDPATTMKMALLLFVLARCGSSITIWKMVKLGFFGVFTVPKVCSSYSTQLTAYGVFWIRRFRDAWESCSHKKAVAFAIFTLVWNLSSIVAEFGQCSCCL
nr:reticulon-like protein B21 [Coffea arabica]